MRILLVEDDARISTYIRKGLEEQGHAVDQAFSGAEALEWAQSTRPDIIILDVMLPPPDGLAVCREIRGNGTRTPIIMLTARDSVGDRVAGLDAGADDYLVKPFALSELFARIRALSRRPPQIRSGDTLILGDLEMDIRRHVVARSGDRVDLTAKEFAILEYLMRDPGRVFSRSLIAEHVWNYESYNQSNIVDVYIRHLRRKLDDGREPKLIHTVRGSGYRVSLD